MRFLLIFLCTTSICAPSILNAQTYFPPILGTDWETVSPESLGWCTEYLPELETFLEESSSKGFLILKDGKIAVEYYMNGFSQSDYWQWNSAGKTLSAFLTGLAQDQGYLDITDKTSDYLGAGWTSMTAAQEDAITIRHQLTMSTGMDDSEAFWICQAPSCFNYLAEPGTRWAYHNAPYTILKDVVEAATSQSYGAYTFNQLSLQAGISGLWVDAFDFNIFFSSPRSMARFGLLVQENGIWDGNVILSDTNYINDMLRPSQTINNAYGYLWWLNGQEDYMVPGLQLVFPGYTTPSAPSSMVSAIGKDGQILSLVPEENLVIVRMGENPDTGDPVGLDFPEALWQKLNKLFCEPTGIQSAPQLDLLPTLFPTLVSGLVSIPNQIDELSVFNLTGQQVASTNQSVLDLASLPNGMYLIRYRINSKWLSQRIIKN